MRSLPYDTLRDFEPITLISHEPTVLVTNTSHPAKTLGEFTAWVKENANKISYPAAADVVAGHVPYMWSVLDRHAIREGRQAEAARHCSGEARAGEAPEYLGRHIKTEIERCSRVLTAAGVQPTN